MRRLTICLLLAMGAWVALPVDDADAGWRRRAYRRGHSGGCNTCSTSCCDAGSPGQAPVDHQQYGQPPGAPLSPAPSVGEGGAPPPSPNGT